MLGDAGAAQCPIERALDLAEPDRMLFPSLIHPAPGLLERHARQRTPHAALSAILSQLTGTSPPGAGRPAAPLSQAQTRVLRYLPAHLPVPEIAGELCVPDRLRCPPGPRRPARHGPAEHAFPGDATTVWPGRVRNGGAAAGRGDRDIASELSISPKTASVHVSNILASLGVSARTEAAATVHRLHVLDRPVTSAALSHLLAPAGRANGARIRLSSNVAARALAISCGYRHSPVKEQAR